MLCDSCQKHLPNDIDYCPYCGRLLPAPTSPPVPYWQRATTALIFGFTLITTLTLSGISIAFWLFAPPAADIAPHAPAPLSSSPMPLATATPTVNLTFVGRNSIVNQASHLTIAGSRIYLINRARTLIVGDVSTSAMLEPQGRYTVDADMLGLASDSGQVYLADGRRVIAINVLNPQAPFPSSQINYLAEWQPPAEAVALAVDGGYLTVATRRYGLHLLDVTNPYQMRRLDGQGIFDDLWDVAVREAFIYLAAGKDGLQILQIGSTSPFVQPVGQYEFAEQTTRSLALLDRNVLLVTVDTEFWLLDITDPTAPFVLNSADFTTQFGSIDEVHIVADRLYFRAANGIGLLDLPSLTLLDFYAVGQPNSQTGLPVAIAVHQQTVYMVDWQGALYRFAIVE